MAYLDFFALPPDRFAALLSILLAAFACAKEPRTVEVLAPISGETRFEVDCNERRICESEAEYRCRGRYEVEQLAEHVSPGDWGSIPFRLRFRCTGAPSGQ